MEQHPVSEFKSKGGFKRIMAAFVNSIDGFQAAWRNEYAFRQEVIVVLIATVVALLLPVSSFQKVLLISVLLLVLLVEIINSAIEAVVDRISLERHPLSKRAKDMGSAAVALAIMIAAMAWIVVLSNRYY
jgi:diacylglycerol kinase (ATP)